MLGKITKKNNIIGLVNYQSIVYQNKTFVAFGPYYSHSIKQRDSSRDCSDCHDNTIINELNTSGKINVTLWDSLNLPLKIIHAQGVIPVPPDYEKVFRFEFADYTGKTDTLFTDPSKWIFLKSSVDEYQMLSEYVLHLTKLQMRKLGASKRY